MVPSTEHAESYTGETSLTRRIVLDVCTHVCTESLRGIKKRVMLHRTSEQMSFSQQKYALQLGSGTDGGRDNLTQTSSTRPMTHGSATNILTVSGVFLSFAIDEPINCRYALRTSKKAC